MAKSLQEIAAALHDRLIYMDGLGDIGTARADQVLALAHDVQAAVTSLVDALDRIDRLERIFLPQSDEVQ